jgi:anti-anti-sigma factor
VAPSPALIKTLNLMKLSEFFLQAPELPSALKLLDDREDCGTVLVDLDLASQRAALVWQGEVTAANLGEIALLTGSRLEQARNTLAIDLTGLRFVDTSGIGLMVKLKKQAARQGVELRFNGASDTVQKIVSHLRMEEYLFGAPA